MSTIPMKLFLPDNIDTFSKGSSANATASDLPGPGRILGKVYGKVGAWIEEFANGVATRTGRGPLAIAKKITKRELECCCTECRRAFPWLPVPKEALVDILGNLGSGFTMNHLEIPWH